MSRFLYLFIFLLSSIFTINVSQAFARSTHNGVHDENTSITVYNQNKAIIRQTRNIDLHEGINELTWNGIANTIDLSSINLRSLNQNNPIKVSEQSYQNDLLTPEAVLARYIDKTVYLRHFFPDGHNEEMQAILLSAPSSQAVNGQGASPYVVLKAGERYILNSQDQIEVSNIPAGLVSQPVLNFKLQAPKTGKEDLNLTYAADNINWQCDYSIVLNREQNEFGLSALATIDNHCGTSFKDVNLKLLAGNVQVIRPAPRAYATKQLMMTAMNAPEAQESSFADYHLYTFDQPVDINNNESKRLTLVSANAVPVIKKYVFDEQAYAYLPPKRKLAVQTKLEFQNNEQANLGKPLPAGQVKVYQEDVQHELEYIGEDRIEHTPIDEKVTVKLGEAFDVTAEKNRISSTQISDHQRRENYKVIFYNHLDHDITVTDLEHSAYEFPVLTSNASFVKVDSNTFQFDVKVPASGKAEITYQIDSKI